MSVLRRVVPALLLTAAVPLGAASTEEAWRLYLQGDYTAATAAAEEMAADEERRTEALSLLGSIAAAQGSFSAARDHWAAAAERGGAAAHEAAAKLALLCTLTECADSPAEALARGAEYPAPADSVASPSVLSGVEAENPPPADGAADSSALSGAGSVPAAPDVVPAAPPAPSSVASSVAAQPATATTGAVFVAGKGTPFDEVREAVAHLTGFLQDRGVEASSPTQEIAVVQESEIVLAQLLAAARERGAVSVLLLDARFGHRERVKATCYDPQGGVLLAETVTGGIGLVRPVRMNATLMERIEEKLAGHVGGPCLPARE